MEDQVLRIAYGVGGLGFRTWISWAIAAFLVAMMTGTAVAQETSHTDVRASLTVDRNHVTVGDVVTLTLEVTHPADYAVVIPRLIREWGMFEVVSQSPAQTDTNGDGTETTRQRLEVALFAAGTFETPELSISIRGRDGSVDRVFPSPAQLTVRSVLSDSAELLRDIRPPADLSPPLWKHPASRAIAALAAAAAMASVAYFVLQYLRARDAQPVSEGDTRNPWEVAIQEMDEIERLDLPGDGRFKEHFTLITGVMHAYVRAMYLENGERPDATEMTTDEIGTEIWRSSLDRKNARLVVDLLLEADLVRFSNYPSSESEAYAASRRTRDFIMETRAIAVDVRQQEITRTQPEARA